MNKYLHSAIMRFRVKHEMTSAMQCEVVYE